MSLPQYHLVNHSTSPEAMHAAQNLPTLPISSQLTVPPSRIQATNVHNFWQVVERFRAGGGEELRIATSISQQDPATADFMRPIAGATLILPRMVPHLHTRNRVDAEDPNTRAVLGWSADYVIGMLHSFVEAADVSTVPALSEYRILPSKEELQAMYQRYFDADPEQRAPPIPTAFVRSPGSKATQQLLCDSKDRNAAPHVMDDIMLRLFKGVLEYERSIKAAPGRLKRVTELSVSTDKGNGKAHLVHYALKRMYSEVSADVMFFALPSHIIQAAGNAPAEKCTYKGKACWRAAAAVAPSQDEFSGVTGSLEWDAKAVVMPPYLQKAAEAVAKRSCGEDWMLQPKIKDMPLLEYRVYVIGGAHAQPEDAVVVYTPATLDERGIALMNLTIPPGHFWSDVVAPPTGPRLVSDPEQSSAVSEAPFRRPWHAPELYNQIVQAGLDGARAMANFDNGRLRMVSNVYVRVDVVLGIYEKDGQFMTVPLINEMDWFNSAMAVHDAWKQKHPIAPKALQGLFGVEWEAASGMDGSIGYRTAKSLLPEIASSRRVHRKGSADAEQTDRFKQGALQQGLAFPDNRSELLSRQPRLAHPHLGEAHLKSWAKHEGL